ncbi:MAG: hypothetical protein WC728_16180 [Elusimicrobiota bacterium]
MYSYKLLRFFDAQTGPIIGMSSTPHPSFWRRNFWYSVAHLHPKWKDPDREDNIFGFVGGGWSRGKGESQLKAAVEAIERWSVRHMATSAAGEAGLSIDPTSNGFAARPQEAGEAPLLRHAYHEALERWSLNRFWDNGDFSFMRHEPPEDIAKLFRPWRGTLHCYTATLAGKPLLSLPAEQITFALCVFAAYPHGAIPGSACALDASDAIQRAMLEAYVHCIAVDRMKKGGRPGSITERRLDFFANNPHAFDMVVERLMISDSSPAAHETPDICFSRHICGPWNPEVQVFRAIVKDSPPITFGGIERFLI